MTSDASIGDTCAAHVVRPGRSTDTVRRDVDEAALANLLSSASSTDINTSENTSTKQGRGTKISQQRTPPPAPPLITVKIEG